MSAQKATLANNAAESTNLADDRRRSPRATYVATAWLSTEAGTRGANQQVVVTNLSLHGVGFTCEHAIELGAIHWIVIGAGGLRTSSRLKVANCRQRDDNSYDIGAEFF